MLLLTTPGIEPGTTYATALRYLLTSYSMPPTIHVRHPCCLTASHSWYHILCFLQWGHQMWHWDLCHPCCQRKISLSAGLQVREIWAKGYRKMMTVNTSHHCHAKINCPLLTMRYGQGWGRVSLITVLYTNKCIVELGFLISEEPVIIHLWTRRSPKPLDDRTLN